MGGSAEEEDSYRERDGGGYNTHRLQKNPSTWTRMRRSTRTSSTSGSTTNRPQEARSLHNQRERSSTTRMSGSSQGRRLRARVLTGSHRGERLISLLSPESLQQWLAAPSSVSSAQSYW